MTYDEAADCAKALHLLTGIAVSVIIAILVGSFLDTFSEWLRRR